MAHSIHGNSRFGRKFHPPLVVFIVAGPHISKHHIWINTRTHADFWLLPGYIFWYTRWKYVSVTISENTFGDWNAFLSKRICDCYFSERVNSDWITLSHGYSDARFWIISKDYWSCDQELILDIFMTSWRSLRHNPSIHIYRPKCQFCDSMAATRHDLMPTVKSIARLQKFYLELSKALSIIGAGPLRQYRQ